MKYAIFMANSVFKLKEGNNTMREAELFSTNPDAVTADATPETDPIAPEVEDRTAVAADVNQPLEKRLEAYEDLIDSEIGDTSFSRARNLEREHGLRQLYLKFEGGNPTGTQKDRIAFAQALDALRRGFDAITVATCGNFGAAIAMAAFHAGLRASVYIPETYHTRRLVEIERFDAEIVRVPGTYEHAVEISRKRASDDEIYDANPGGANTALQLSAYGGIAYEIYDELRDAPAVISVAVSNGTTLAGIYKGFVSLYRRGKTSRIPKFVAGSSYRKNPIILGWSGKSSSCMDLVPESIRETPINEPLVNWHSVDGDLALDAIRRTGGFAGHVSDRNMTALSKKLREQEGLYVLPAATAGLHTLLEQHKASPLAGDRYVAVLTGRKL
jgi:threonine synthase